MNTLLGSAVIAALASLVSQESSPLAEEAAPPLTPAVIVHCGDHVLLETLKHAGEVWHEADEFFIGALRSDDLAGLEARGVRTHALNGVSADDELFLVDLEQADIRVEIDPSARVEFRHGKWGVVSVAGPTHHAPTASRPGHSCSANHTAVARHAMQPVRPTMVRGAPYGPNTAALMSHNPTIQVFVDQVSKVSLEASVQSYSSYVNRASMNLSNYAAATAQLIAELQSYGYSPRTQLYSAMHGPNVWVDITGQGAPDQFVVIGAHFDTLNYAVGPTGLCPGADDNTSGSAGVLEIARVLASVGASRHSIRMIWFSGEENGLLGSGAHVNRMAQLGEDVLAMLNMDMIAYRDPNDVRDVDFASNNTSPSLTALCLQTCPLYVANWAANTSPFHSGNSDHYEFHAAGHPAVIFREDFVQHFPTRHTPADAYPNSTTDFELAEMIVRGVLASALTIADISSLAIAHTELPDTTTAVGPYSVDAQVTSVYGSTVTSVTLNYRVAGASSWTSVPMSNTSGPNWTASLPTHGSPLTLEYYIEAVDDQGAAEVSPYGANLGASPYDFYVGVRNMLYATSFEEATDNGWTHGFLSEEDDWQRGDPAGEAGDPASAFAGANAWGNDLGGPTSDGSYAPSTFNWLRSPPIDCSAASNVLLEFRRWLNVDGLSGDFGRVRVNGQVIWESSSAVRTADSSWIPMRFDISSLAAGNPAVQIEFRLLAGDGFTVFGGWNIDEFALVELQPSAPPCPSTTYCTAKVNSLGCTPQISASGIGSTSSPLPFTLSASNVLNQKAGVLFYGYTSGATSFQGGIKCVVGQVRRSPTQNSGGATGANDCSGVLSYDFNTRIQAGTDPALIVGANVFAQWWYRDSADPTGFGTGLSDAVQFNVCP